MMLARGMGRGSDAEPDTELDVDTTLESAQVFDPVLGEFVPAELAAALPIDNWSETTPLPAPAAGIATAYAGHVFFMVSYVAIDDATVQNWDVYSAPVRDDGSLGEWTQTLSPTFDMGRMGPEGARVGNLWVFPMSPRTLIAHLGTAGNIERWSFGPPRPSTTPTRRG